MASKTTETTTTQTLGEFVQLLELCRAPGGGRPVRLSDNPHLYDAQHRVYLRLCHGNIPEHACARGTQ